MVIEKRKSFVFTNNVLIKSGTTKYVGVGFSVIWYLQVIVGLFALIIHKRKTVVCILNTLIP